MFRFYQQHLFAVSERLIKLIAFLFVNLLLNVPIKRFSEKPLIKEVTLPLIKLLLSQLKVRRAFPVMHRKDRRTRTVKYKV